MNKKVIGIIGIFILICIIGVFAFFFVNHRAPNKEEPFNKTNTNEISDNSENTNNRENDNTATDNKKVLVVYFSATNHTKGVAEKIADNLNGDLFAIEPKDAYTTEDLNWSNEQSRVSREHDNESLRNVELKTANVDNWDSYDTVLIGYPIWWGVAAWPVDTFVKANDFTGKTVIPFCTSASSGLGQSGALLESEANGGDWKEGHRFTSSPTDADIKAFTDSIK
ncbi:MAG: flavodoxin [Candidatus Fimenecus sp.]